MRGVLGKRIEKLSKECEKPTQAGRSNLKLIKNGLLHCGVSRWPLDPDALQPIPEDSSGELYIHPGTDVFSQQSHNPSILHGIQTQIDSIRQANQDALRNDMFSAAASSSTQVMDCGQTISIQRRDEELDDDSSSD